MIRNQTKKRGYHVRHKRRKTHRFYANGGAEPLPTTTEAATDDNPPTTDDNKEKKNGDGEDDDDDESIPDREQATDFIFYNPQLNPASGYSKYIVVNQPPKYMYLYDSFGYQIMGIEEMLHALSKNRPQIPSYRVRKNVKTTKARSQTEIEEGNKKIEEKKQKLKKKIKQLNRIKRG
jgi:hypothetical protein